MSETLLIANIGCIVAHDVQIKKKKKSESWDLRLMSAVQWSDRGTTKLKFHTKAQYIYSTVQI